MSLHDFIGTYRIEAIDRAMEDFETLKHPLKIQQDNLVVEVNCLDFDHVALYQEVEYDSQKDVIRGRFSTGSRAEFTIEVLEPNKKVYCHIGGVGGTIPGSWTAEDPDTDPQDH